MNLEHELRASLRRKEPPPGFTERVLAALAEAPAAKPGARPHRWRSLAAAALLLIVLGGGSARYVQQRREGERAREQVLLALHIANAKLRDAQSHVHEISQR